MTQTDSFEQIIQRLSYHNWFVGLYIKSDGTLEVHVANNGLYEPGKIKKILSDYYDDFKIVPINIQSSSK